MPDAPLPARRFTESDTDAILRRAAELASGTAAESKAGGLTIDEMESLATEAGLNPELVRRAAREVAVRKAQRTSPWLGAPERVLLERELPREITEEAWEMTVAEIQRTFGSMGYASKVGRTRSWSVGGSGPHGSYRGVTITVSTQSGKTSVRAEEAFNLLAGRLFGGIIGGLGGGTTGVWIGIGMGALHSPTAAVLLVLSSLCATYGLARRLFTRAVARRTAELDELLDRVVAAATSE